MEDLLLEICDIEITIKRLVNEADQMNKHYQHLKEGANNGTQNTQSRRTNYR